MVVLEPANEPSRSDRTARSAVSVLLIDDDQDASEIIALLLKRAGYTVALAANGCEGLAMLERVRPQLILLDVHMPVMDGPRFR